MRYLHRKLSRNELGLLLQLVEELFFGGLERVLQEVEAEGSAAVPERVGGAGGGCGEGSVEEVLVAETGWRCDGGREEFEFPVHGERRFGVEEEGIIGRAGIGSRVALHDEPGGFGGDEEEDVFALQSWVVGLLGV